MAVPQVVKVFPPAASGQNPIHKPTTQEGDHKLFFSSTCCMMIVI